MILLTTTQIYKQYGIKRSTLIANIKKGHIPAGEDSARGYKVWVVNPDHLHLLDEIKMGRPKTKRKK